ncbi:hypothetical protein LCM20_09480 [Halobacillus litoralis]|uniref:hypothetical protein n=1 Tax=Halobacillus litoralis TaxID=45668 RepID=UPI001CD3E6D5|nr:hypothetical protein [Halobacillus litoralis]MCA0970820.1 hypothetical protein [Halobacillus litoralis]
MKIIRAVFWTNIVLSGIVIVFFAYWFATGFISEMPEDTGIVAPEFFAFIPGWLIASGLCVLLMHKGGHEKDPAFGILFFSIFLTWLSPFFGMIFLNIIGLL